LQESLNIVVQLDWIVLHFDCIIRSHVALKIFLRTHILE
jgi:hypothetical protein